ncbi:MAG: hypothetical protein B7X06_03905 [Verrucomicrobia bacterium 21-51-4]|nr:MAG: hypothetical protein B7X06_03905 [Verrucomicrobia bacterium 21-51-4]HQU09258.1 HAD-IA family hydrolase [Opitutales bacterium]
MNFARIKAVTLNAMGTLIEPTPSVAEIYSSVLQGFEIHIPEDELADRFKNTYEAFRPQWPTKCTGTKSEREFWDLVAKHTLGDLCPTNKQRSVHKALWDAFGKAENWQELPGVRPVLELLAGSNLVLALLSNGGSRLSRKILKGLGMKPLFQDIFIASEIGYAKPDTRFFEHARAVLDLAPHEILHVGNHWEEDVEGALAAGWQAAWLGEEDPGKPEVLHLHRLADLVDLLLQSPV